jgi:hypothetical protein
MRKTWLLRVAAMAIVGTAAPWIPAQGASQGRCVTARIASPFRLPDGVLREAGTLTLCDTREFTPVSNLHMVRVDRRPVGMFLSLRRNAEGVDRTVPEIVFQKDAAGTLTLMGYVLPARGESVAYLMKRPERALPFGDSMARVERPQIEPQR